MKYYPIIDKIYRKNFHLVINQDPEKFFDWLKQFHKGADNDLKEIILNCNGCCIYHFSPYTYIYIKNFDWKIDEQACLVHELNHFVDFVFDECGIEGNLRNTEVRAYYFEYIFSECYKQLKKTYKKYDKKILSSVRRKRTTKK